MTESELIIAIDEVHRELTNGSYAFEQWWTMEDMHKWSSINGVSKKHIEKIFKMGCEAGLDALQVKLAEKLMGR
jgi:hypothetical protein